MSSTNKTEHYNLPQFIGSDIPTWLGDFNSAMTAIDSGINAAATSASQAATTAAQALNRCPFPVGYGGFFQTDPNSIYADTTWKQKKDVFILASGDTYGAGSTGGEAQHKLTEAELPQISGYFSLHGQENGTDIYKSHGHCTGVTVNNKYRDIPTVVNNASSLSDIGFAFGGDHPHNNMPPYFAMPFWVRTA